MKYGYARVSTSEQNTARQLDAFKAEGVDAVVEEKASGKDFEGRKEYQKLRESLKAGDVLVVMSLDRFGRNYEEVLAEWRYLVKGKGVDIKVLDMPLIDTTQGQGLVGRFVGDIVLQILAFVAETERENIRKRQAQGIAAAKARGKKFGRPGCVLPDNFEEVCALYAKGKLSIRGAAQEAGMAKTTFSKFYKLRCADGS